MTEIIKEHKGHTITIGDQDMRFWVAGPIVNDRRFGSFDEAENAVDEAVKKDEVQSRRRIAMGVLDWEGHSAIITGIHASNGTILGVDRAAVFYPNVRWIKESLERASKLRSEASQIDELVAPYKMGGYGFRFSGLTHSEAVDKLVNVIETSTQAALSAAESQ